MSEHKRQPVVNFIVNSGTEIGGLPGAAKRRMDEYQPLRSMFRGLRTAARGFGTGLQATIQEAAARTPQSTTNHQAEPLMQTLTGDEQRRLEEFEQEQILKRKQEERTQERRKHRELQLPDHGITADSIVRSNHFVIDKLTHTAETPKNERLAVVDCSDSREEPQTSLVIEAVAGQIVVDTFKAIGTAPQDLIDDLKGYQRVLVVTHEPCGACAAKGSMNYADAQHADHTAEQYVATHIPSSDARKNAKQFAAMIAQKTGIDTAAAVSNSITGNIELLAEPGTDTDYFMTFVTARLAERAREARRYLDPEKLKTQHPNILFLTSNRGSLSERFPGFFQFPGRVFGISIPVEGGSKKGTIDNDDITKLMQQIHYPIQHGLEADGTHDSDRSFRTLVDTIVIETDNQQTSKRIARKLLAAPHMKEWIKFGQDHGRKHQIILLQTNSAGIVETAEEWHPSNRLRR